MNFIHSALDKVRDRYAPITSTSTFRETGQLTPEEFALAGDFLTYKFPSWSWSDASHPSKRVYYLPSDKQFLVTRGVPCHRRLEEGYKTADGEQNIQGEGEDGDEGWLATGGQNKTESSERDVRTLDGSGNIHSSEHEEQEEIPDIEDEEDDSEAIIRDTTSTATKTPLRSYTLYITYSPYYRTPRFYLSGYEGASNQPLDPTAMMEDIMGDYKDKTVTLEDFPFFDASQSVKMASIHPCRHASVMKSLLDRADAALKLRRERAKVGKGAGASGRELGMEGLVDETNRLALSQVTDPAGHKAGVAAAGGNGGDEWEVLQHEGNNEEEGSAIRVDQYLVVFLKFAASVTPTIEYDFTMGV
ncbi:MAG: hypothetical protein Q9159_006935 [Coniocarpon cinnabarinum]